MKQKENSAAKRLLNRQLKKSNLDINSLPENKEDWKGFLEKIQSSYENNIEDSYLLERSLLISSKELDDYHTKLNNSAKLAALGEMAAGTAHEINNPLAIISGYNEYIEKIVTSNGDIPLDKALIYIDKIRATITRITKITDSLRKFSSGYKSDSFEDIIITELINETIEFCQQKMSENQIKLNLELPPSDLHINCHSTQLSQVIINLLNNSIFAVKDLPEKWITITSEVSDNNLNLSIIDSGKGIPEDIKNKIMDPFFTTKPVGSGTGLGLSLSQGIIKGHHGNLSINSSSPNTHFVISLPLKN